MPVRLRIRKAAMQMKNLFSERNYYYGDHEEHRSTADFERLCGRTGVFASGTVLRLHFRPEKRTL